MCCFNTEYGWAFFAGGFLAGMRADKILDARWCVWMRVGVALMCVVWSASPVREAVRVPRAGSDCSFRSRSKTLPTRI
jgi:hypothetical protein